MRIYFRPAEPAAGFERTGPDVLTSGPLSIFSSILLIIVREGRVWRTDKQTFWQPGETVKKVNKSLDRKM